MTEDEGYSSRIFGSSKTEFDFEIKVERGKKNFEYFERGVTRSCIFARILVVSVVYIKIGKFNFWPFVTAEGSATILLSNNF